MDLTFDIRLQGAVRDSVANHLWNVDKREGKSCLTKRGAEKERVKYESICEASQKEVVALLKLNFPEFIGRFENVWHKRFYQQGSEYFVTINRVEVEDV